MNDSSNVVELTIDGAIDIPEHIREELDLEPGQEVAFIRNAEGDIIIKPQ